jgi:hypothetical protein
MQLDENDHQLLGFIELSRPELHETIGRQHGKQLIYI